MNKIRAILLLIIISAFSSQAQKLYVCNSFTDRGEPVDPIIKTEFDTTTGLNAFALFSYKNLRLNSDLLYLFIDKIVDKHQIPFDSRALQTKPDRDWTAYDYQFTEPGNYILYIADSFGKRLASYRLTLTSPEPLYDEPPQDALYYTNSEIIFCQTVLGDKPIRKYRALSFGDNGQTVAVLLSNKKPLRTNRILIVVWRKKYSSFEYDDFVESRKYLVQHNWDDTFFKYRFKEPGEYKFSIYDQNERLIKSAFFTVYK